MITSTPDVSFLHNYQLLCEVLKREPADGDVLKFLLLFSYPFTFPFYIYVKQCIYDDIKDACLIM